MPLYYTKESLYREIASFRDFLGIPQAGYPFDLICLLKRYSGLAIQEVPFITPELRGISYFGDTEHDDIILLNSNRSYQEQNFDCAHECIHLALHRNEKHAVFSCTDNVKEKQDPFLEWHANEGAAELLVPYRDFIPSFYDLLLSFQQNQNSYMCIRTILAEKYNVTYTVISNRIETLRYEIDQYASGIPLDKIVLLSKKKQESLGIVTTNYSVLCDFPLEWDSII